MNGQDRKLYNKMYADIMAQIVSLKQDIVELKTKMTERWNAHAERSHCIDKKINKIFEKLDGLPCRERAWIPKAISVLYGIVIIMLGFIVRSYFLGQ